MVGGTGCPGEGDLRKKTVGVGRGALECEHCRAKRVGSKAPGVRAAQQAQPPALCPRVGWQNGVMSSRRLVDMCMLTWENTGERQGRGQGTRLRPRGPLCARHPGWPAGGSSCSRGLLGRVLRTQGCCHPHFPGFACGHAAVRAEAAGAGAGWEQCRHRGRLLVLSLRSAWRTGQGRPKTGPPPEGQERASAARGGLHSDGTAAHRRSGGGGR